MSGILKILDEHHIRANKEVGNQIITDCVFCGKEDHFYINKDKGLWDCKSCGLKGNIPNILHRLASMYHKNLYETSNRKHLERLSADRGIPMSAFRSWLVGWDPIGRRYTIPIVNGKDSCCDIRLYKLKMKTRASAGSTQSLMNAHRIAKRRTIYLCEGEWDGIALEWLFGKLKMSDTCAVVAVSGAGIFKKDWLPHFRGCDVQVLYDNDQAGEAGEVKVNQLLNGTARSISFINWLDSLPTGFDLRDWVKHGIQVKKLNGCWRNLKKLFVDTPRLKQGDTPEAQLIDGDSPEVVEGDLDLEKEFAVYQKWMHLPDEHVLEIMFGSIFANLYISGDPVWLFLVAPPGGSKSELLMSLVKCIQITCLTSLTPHSLISGYTWGSEGKDPSLIPQLDGKILVLKDFTTITSMHFAARDEIFGILRDVYDGKTEKQFGTGLRREYTSKFGILAGTTPVIDSFSTIHQSLGERFLKYRIQIDTHINEEKKIMRALANINNELVMREEMQGAAFRIMSKHVDEKLPEFPQQYLKKVIALAQFCAKMRGVVVRDNYTQQVLYKPSTEVGTRLAKQLMKLGIGIGIMRDLKELGLREYLCMCKVALHTCPDRLISIIYTLYRSGKEDGLHELKTKEISEFTRLPSATVFRLLEDLYLLNVVRRTGKNSKYYWSIDDSIMSLLKISGILD